MLEEAQASWENISPLSSDDDGMLSRQDDAVPEHGAYPEQLLTFAAAAGAAVLTRHLLKAGWRKTLDREPPQNPASSAVDWQDALVWGAISGALVGVTRIVSRRASTAAYRRIRS